MKNRLLAVTIKDCRVDTFRCPGKGGQNVNKVSSGVRVTHDPSGAVAASCLTRDQFRNKRDAFVKMAESREFRAWLVMRISEIQSGKSIEETIEAAMQPQFLKVEARTEHGWVEEV